MDYCIWEVPIYIYIYIYGRYLYIYIYIHGRYLYTHTYIHIYIYIYCHYWISFPHHNKLVQLTPPPPDVSWQILQLGLQNSCPSKSIGFWPLNRFSWSNLHLHYTNLLSKFTTFTWTSVSNQELLWLWLDSGFGFLNQSPHPPSPIPIPHPHPPTASHPSPQVRLRPAAALPGARAAWAQRCGAARGRWPSTVRCGGGAGGTGSYGVWIYFDHYLTFKQWKWEFGKLMKGAMCVFVKRRPKTRVCWTLCRKIFCNDVFAANKIWVGNIWDKRISQSNSVDACWLRQIYPGFFHIHSVGAMPSVPFSLERKLSCKMPWPWFDTQLE